MLPPPPRSTLFPYTTLFRSVTRIKRRQMLIPVTANGYWEKELSKLEPEESDLIVPLDRKSTRLNSSHTVISYAVFCLKKKKKKNDNKKYTSACNERQHNDRE